MEAYRLKLRAVFPGTLPILLAAVWIAMVAMTLMDFAGFAAATGR